MKNVSTAPTTSFAAIVEFALNVQAAKVRTAPNAEYATTAWNRYAIGNVCRVCLTRSIWQELAGKVGIATIVLNEFGISIAKTRIKRHRSNDVTRSQLNAVAERTAGIRHHAPSALTIGEHRELLVATVDIKERGRNLEISVCKRRKVSAKFIGPVLLGLIDR